MNLILFCVFLVILTNTRMQETIAQALLANVSNSGISSSDKGEPKSAGKLEKPNGVGQAESSKDDGNSDVENAIEDSSDDDEDDDGDGNEDENAIEDSSDEDDDGDGNEDETAENDAAADSLNKVNVQLRTKKEALDRYMSDNDKGAGALDKLMSESTELATEVGNVFKVFAKREVALTKDMEKLREALSEAVSTLKQALAKEHRELSQVEVEVEATDDADGQHQTTSDRQKRQINRQKNQYKACVSLEPLSGAEDPFHSSVRAQSYRIPAAAPQIQPLTREFIPPNPEPIRQNSINPGYVQVPAQRQLPPTQGSTPTLGQRVHTYVQAPGPNSQMVNAPPGPLKMFPPSDSKHPGQQPSPPVNLGYPPSLPPSPPPFPVRPSPQDNNRVELNEVYWLRLNPQQRQEGLRKRLDELLKEKQSSGRDVLIIPVSHNFKNTDEVKNGFLRAVKLRPGKVLHSDSPMVRQIRDIEIREI